MLSSSSKEFETLLSSLSELDATCSFCGGFYRIVQLLFFFVLQDTKNNIKFKIKFYMDFFFPLGPIITLAVLIFEFFSTSSLGTKPQLFYMMMVELAVKCGRQPVFQVEAMLIFLGFFFFFWRRVRLKNN